MEQESSGGPELQEKYKKITIEFKEPGEFHHWRYILSKNGAFSDHRYIISQNLGLKTIDITAANNGWIVLGETKTLEKSLEQLPETAEITFY